MSGRRTAARLAPLCAALAVAACESQWYEQASRSEIVRTDVVVRTEPPGALVSFDGAKQDAAPVRIPVEYEHTTQQWVRVSNQGTAIRESTGPLGTILLFPVWIPASFFHAEQEMKRHVYARNRHTVSAEDGAGGYAEKALDLQGEATFDVLLRLERPSR